ncbi:MAG: hypothetical protein JWR80_5460 [Bradyrhizobium sp.]|nr:hypothetical protein [Bradyrhizobium sp.]
MARTIFAPTAQWSLATRLTAILVSSLTVLALALGIGGSWYISRVAEQTSDRVLGASANSIAQTIGVERGVVTLAVSSGAFGMLEDNARDNVYYQVSQGRTFLTGYSDFPKASIQGVVADTPSFRYDTYLGQRVRVATALKRVPRISTPVVVQVAETLDERDALRSNMLMGLGALEFLLVAFTGVILWPAVKLGLRPVTKLRRDLATRPKDRLDITPLNTAVPTEVRGLVESFNGLLDQLGKSLGNIRQFMADATHQICTPLAVIRTNIAVVQQQEDLEGTSRQWLSEIDHAALRLSQLVAQLAALSRAEDPSLSIALDLVPVDLADFVAALTREMAPMAVARDIDIRFDQDRGDHTVLADRLAISEIAMNLLDNAIRYIDRGGTIDVSVFRAGDIVGVRIEDDGPGIPPDQYEMVFRRFHRLRRDQNVPGSGLGLPIVRALADALQATLQLRQSGAGGLCIELLFGRFVLATGTAIARLP